jgi:hypothetical protein
VDFGNFAKQHNGGGGREKDLLLFFSQRVDTPPRGEPPEGPMTWPSHKYAFSADISKILYNRANIQ